MTIRKKPANPDREPHGHLPPGPVASSRMETLPTSIVLIHEDGRFVRSMERLLTTEGFDVRAFTSGAAFLSQPAAAGPVCAVVNLDLDDVPGLELQRRLSAAGRGEQIVFITALGGIPSCVAAMKAGAADYLLRPVDAPRFLTAVRDALNKSDAWWHRRSRQSSAALLVSTLTRRQKEVMKLMIRGRLNREIATDLGTRESTIKIHRRRVMEKLRVKSVPEIVILAQIAGVVSPA